MPAPTRIAASLVPLLLLVPLTAAKAPPARNPHRAMAAYEFYVTIQGSKQGTFRGESEREMHRNKIPGLAYQFSVKVPRDLATGYTTGKRLYSPITFTKAWGAASPQLWQALVTNELLSSVLFEFVTTNANGEEMVYYTVKLTNANVSDIRAFTPSAGAMGAAPSLAATGGRDLEEVSFVFQNIEITSVEGKTMFADSWVSKY